MKSFGITSLYLALTFFQVANAMRPHSFLIPNTEVMRESQETVSKNEMSWSRRRGGKMEGSNESESSTEVQTVVRILLGNNWGMTSTSEFANTASSGAEGGSRSSRNGGGK